MGKRLRGIRPWKGGWQAYVRVKGTLRSKTFPFDTAIEKLKAWRLAQQVSKAGPGLGPTFAHDVVDYLTRISALPTYGQRAQHLTLWLEALGRDRARASITAAEIDRVLQGWLATCAPDTVRKRRTSLLSLFHKLDGKAAANPVRESTPPKPRAADVRGLETAPLQQLLASLPPSKTAARLAVLAWTGLPPGMLMRVTAADVNFARAEVRVVARQKGAGSPARVLPLTPQAVAAFTEMIARDAFGPFAIAAAGRVLHRGCKRCGLPSIRLYDLRHSFGAMLYRQTKDLPTVARFLLHKSLTSTARYAAAAVGDVDRAAALAVGQLSGQPSPGSAAPISTKRHRVRKGRKARKRPSKLGKTSVI